MLQELAQEGGNIRWARSWHQQLVYGLRLPQGILMGMIQGKLLGSERNDVQGLPFENSLQQRTVQGIRCIRPVVDERTAEIVITFDKVLE